MKQRTRLRSIFSNVSVALAVVGIVCFYHWTVETAGGFQRPGEEDYYNFMVRGWRSGHLYMSKEPTAEMRALSDPYDPASNGDKRLADASYFKGHYYLYFGAAPAALLMLPYDLLTGRELGTTTAIFVFSTIGYLASCWLWLGIRSRYFADSSIWVGIAGVLLLGTGTHVLALESRPLVWELPISMGYAFSMLALVGINLGLHGRRPAWALGFAGCALGIATAARPPCLLGAVMLIPALLWLRKQPISRISWIRCTVAAGSGLGFWVLAILAYNYARFGNPLQFGQDYQLSGVYESKVHHFSLTYIPHNLYLYFFHPGTWSLRFPFLSASYVPTGPNGYLGNWSEAICGLGVTFPFVWLTLAVPLAWRDRPEESRLKAMMGSIAVYSFVMCLVVAAYFVATVRYMADFAPAFALIALCGLLGVERWASRGFWRKGSLAVPLAVCVTSIAAGVFLSFDYHGGMLKKVSPQKWERMSVFFSKFGF